VACFYTATLAWNLTGFDTSATASFVLDALVLQLHLLWISDFMPQIGGGLDDDGCAMGRNAG